MSNDVPPLYVPVQARDFERAIHLSVLAVGKNVVLSRDLVSPSTTGVDIDRYQMVMSPDRARSLASDLIAAADKADRWTG